jgi:hypothetical protein
MARQAGLEPATAGLEIPEEQFCNFGENLEL